MSLLARGRGAGPKRLSQSCRDISQVHLNRVINGKSVQHHGTSQEINLLIATQPGDQTQNYLEDPILIVRPLCFAEGQFQGRQGLRTELDEKVGGLGTIFLITAEQMDRGPGCRG